MSVQNNEDKKIKRLSLIIFLVVVLVIGGGFAVYYILHQQRQMKDMTETYQIEKETLEDEYDYISQQYEGYKFKASNDSLLALITTEQMKVDRLREELRTVKATNTKRINELNRELSTLRAIMRGYIVQIDSLNAENERLKQQNQEVTRRYQQSASAAAQLTKEKEQLTERVNMASRLDVTNITITPVNSRGKEQKRIDRMEQFVVSFKVVKNITAPVGEKWIYVRIQKPDDDVLVKSRADVFEFEGREINYSMKKLIIYDGEEQDITLYWNIEEYLSPGVYRVDIFADGNLIGRKTFELEK